MARNFLQTVRFDQNSLRLIRHLLAHCGQPDFGRGPLEKGHPQTFLDLFESH